MSRPLTLVRRCPPVAAPDGELRLPYELRMKSRLRTQLTSGEEAVVATERGRVLRSGEFLASDDGRVVRVSALAEKVLHVVCADALALARAAYHLGNRHVAVELGESFLRILVDPVLAQMLLGLGASVHELEVPFEPEAGAYGDHGHGAGKIHDYGGAGHEH